MIQTDFSTNQAESYINWYYLMLSNNRRPGYAMAWALWMPTLFLIVAYFIRG